MVPFLAQINAFESVNGSRMTFNLGNLEISCWPGDTTPLHIRANNVTLCNGTILLGKQSLEHDRKLCVDGCGVLLEGITIKGGHTGMFIRPGGSVIMQDCVVRDAYIVMQVGVTAVDIHKGTPAGKRATLVAHRVKMLDYGRCGLSIQHGANVHLHLCVVNENRMLIRLPDVRNCAIQITGPDSCLEAHKVTCNLIDHKPAYAHGGMLCESGGRAILRRCTISCDPESDALTVYHTGSNVELWYCTLSNEPVADQGAMLPNNCCNNKLVSDIFRPHVNVIAIITFAHLKAWTHKSGRCSVLFVANY